VQKLLLETFNDLLLAYQCAVYISRLLLQKRMVFDDEVSPGAEVTFFTTKADLFVLIQTCVYFSLLVDNDITLLQLFEWIWWRGVTRGGTTARSQARNQGGRRGTKSPLANFSPPLEKYVGHNLKVLDIVWKIWATLKKLLDPWCPKQVMGLPGRRIAARRIVSTTSQVISSVQ